MYKLYKDNVNPGLASLLSLLNFDRLYVKALGTRVWDDKGNEYLDFLGGYGSLNFGHNHPDIVDAVEKVAAMPNLLQAAVNSLAGAAGHNIAAITPGELKNTFFCNSGAEAVEGALKLARAYTGRSHIITTENSFHGKTLGSLSVTGRSKYQEPFRPLLPGVVTIPFGDTEALEKALKEHTCAAFIVEPIQGEGGINLSPAGYLQKAHVLCKEQGALLIMDEIQTGFGRTGANFACQSEGVVPDILCLAKSLGGGVMPVGALVTTEKIWQKAYGGIDKCLLHTSTFGGNTRAMAAVIASVNLLVRDKLAEKAKEKGEYLIKELKELAKASSMIKDVRGRGLFIGVEFNQQKGFLNNLTSGMINKYANDYTGALVAGELYNNYNIISAYTLNNPNVIRLEPPLNVTNEDLDRLIDAFKEIFARRIGLGSLVLKAGKSVLKGVLQK